MEKNFSPTALIYLNGWLKENMDCDSGQFWSHATFDFPVLTSAYLATDLKSAIPHRRCRDMRTIEMFFGNKIEWPTREGVHHDALDDAIFQTIAVQRMLKVARNEEYIAKKFANHICEPATSLDY